MKLQQVTDHLWAATEQAKLLENSTTKYDILETLTQARDDLAAFSTEIIAKLDAVSQGLDRL